MNKENEKEIAKFMLDAIEKLSWTLLTGKYETREIDEIYQNAQAYIFELEQ